MIQLIDFQEPGEENDRVVQMASGAFLTADLIAGGYVNPISLDESIDTSYAAGKAILADLRYTSRGGLAVTRSARELIASRKKNTQ